MARVLLKHWRLCNRPLFASYCSGTIKNDLGQTTILVQQGCDIQELPVIVRKLGQDQFVAFCSNKVPTDSFNGSTPNGSDSNGKNGSQPASFINIEEVMKNIDNCLTTNGIFLIIDSIPSEDLTSEIAVHAFNKITRIETLVTMQNLESSKVYKRIVECVLQKGDNATCLGLLGTLKSYLDLDATIAQVCDDILQRNVDNKLSIEETCEAILRFVEVKRNASAEQFWTSLIDLEKHISPRNIQNVYAILPYIKLSRRTLMSVLERKITNFWWQLGTDAVTEILGSLEACSLAPFRTMTSLGRWTNTNIHALSETSLESVIGSFTVLGHTDQQIERAVERYVKAKGVKIKSQSLVVALLNHCMKFRIRNYHILNGSIEYFIANAENIEPGYLKSIFCPFGYLNYQPLNAVRFWQTLEEFMDKNFVKFQPNDVVDMMLSCVYLEKYPLNFVKRIFNPYFLDVLHTTNPPEKLHKIRSNLKLFDTSLTLECNRYEGPLLPKDHMAKSVWQDGRIKRIVNQITQQLGEIAGGPECLSKSVVLYQLPMNELYIIDALFHPKGMANMWSFNIRRERNIHVAVLVHLPEHFDTRGEYLIGPQAMRIRHFRKMGMRVATLKYEMLAKLRVYPKDLQKYLVARMKEALPAIEANV